MPDVSTSPLSFTPTAFGVSCKLLQSVRIHVLAGDELHEHGQDHLVLRLQGRNHRIGAARLASAAVRSELKYCSPGSWIFSRSSSPAS
jgi:hypothetical protein